MSTENDGEWTSVVVRLGVRRFQVHCPSHSAVQSFLGFGPAAEIEIHLSDEDKRETGRSAR